MLTGTQAQHKNYLSQNYLINVFLARAKRFLVDEQ